MPLILCGNAREKADRLGCVDVTIDTSFGCGTVDMFLVTWRLQIAPSVHRYPSPVGRLGHTPCQAPDFLRFGSECYRDGQGSAQFPLSGNARWNNAVIPVVVPLRSITCKGADTCISTRSNPHSHSPLLRCWDCRPVATRLVNRRFWAARPVPAQPSQRAVMPSPVPQSAARPMSPIARPIRNAADASARPNHSRNSTVRTTRPGGLFYAIAAGSFPGQEKTDGKGLTCSKSS